VSDIHFIDSPDVLPGSRVAVVAGRYNRDIVDRLLQGCLDTLAAKGIAEDAITVVKVPGAFELPVVAKRLAAGGEVDAVIALGAVIRGDTPHFDYVAGECARGLARVAVDFELPVIFGVLTVENEQQALDRAGGGKGNKGTEAALTALEMISVMHRLGS
jgi:6,7-dimethyl-8-ribityllumazine synthase